MTTVRGLLLPLLLAGVLATLSWAKQLEVKWAEGNNRKPDRGLSEKNYYLEHKEPEGMMHGPEALFFLNGMCLEASVDRYLYRVCPFQNVTMRRITASRATLIGYWMEWSEDHRVQHFSMGQSCGGKTRTASVRMQCVSADEAGHGAALTTPTLPPDAVKEEGSCHHSFSLALPLACRLLDEAVVPPDLSDDNAFMSVPSTTVAAAEPVSSDSSIEGTTPGTVAETAPATSDGTASSSGEEPPHSTVSDSTISEKTVGDNTVSGGGTANKSSSDAVQASSEESDDKTALLWALQAKIDDLQQAVADLLQTTPSTGTPPSSDPPASLS